VNLHRTWDMEHTAHFLALRHARVLVRATYRVLPAIRFRSKLVPLPMWIVRQRWSQMDRWEHEGGVCVLQRRMPWNEIPEHDAQLFCECPQSLKYLEKWSRRTLSTSVVYWPPTWEGHAWTAMRHAKPGRLRKDLLALRALIRVVEKAPVFTPIVYKARS
jgi:hypothetical protein